MYGSGAGIGMVYIQQKRSKHQVDRSLVCLECFVEGVAPLLQLICDLWSAVMSGVAFRADTSIITDFVLFVAVGNNIGLAKRYLVAFALTDAGYS